MIKDQSGQSLIEILIATGVFAIIASAVVFLVFDSHTFNRLGHEFTLATYLAEEGLEATKEIRGTDLANLPNGEHGLLNNGDWSFSGSSDDLSNILGNGQRTITISEPEADIKVVTSTVTWDFNDIRSETITLSTQFTNWQESSGGGGGGQGGGGGNGGGPPGGNGPPGQN